MAGHIGAHRNTKYNVNESYFEKIDTPDKAYFLGLMYADGNVSNRAITISLQEKDLNILEKFKNYTQFTGKLQLVILNNPNHSNHIKLQIYSRKLVRDISKLGCIPNKTYSLKYPNIAKKDNLKIIYLK